MILVGQLGQQLFALCTQSAAAAEAGRACGCLHSHPTRDAAEEPETVEVLLVRMSGSVLAEPKSVGLQLGVNIFLSRPNGPALCA